MQMEQSMDSDPKDIQMGFTGSVAQHVGQSTAVEQSRAAAEVQAQIVVAQKFPRNERLAVGRIQQACGRLSLAQKAFYSMPRAGGQVTGISIHLAREMARCWGNMHESFSILSQDFDRGESEVQARAWDMETNVDSVIRFIVPHRIHTKSSGTKVLHDPREIYELIASASSRRLRQCILSLIPSDVVADAERICKETLQKGDGKPLNQRVSQCVAAFARLGVSRDMLMARIGVKAELMSVDHLTDLHIVYQSIRDGHPVSAFFGNDDEGNVRDTIKVLEAEDSKEKKTSQIVSPDTQDPAADAPAEMVAAIQERIPQTVMENPDAARINTTHRQEIAEFEHALKHADFLWTQCDDPAGHKKGRDDEDRLLTMANRLGPEYAAKFHQAKKQALAPLNAHAEAAMAAMAQQDEQGGTHAPSEPPATKPPATRKQWGTPK